VLTLNLHKGFSALGRRDVLHDIRLAVRQVDADVVFLQEVVGEPGDAGHSQYEFLADSIWDDHAYGRNAVSPQGHHGNALLSRFPITQWVNHDISEPDREPRGLLQCSLAVPGHPRPLHAFCVHLGLRERERRRQLRTLARLLAPLSRGGEPVVVAGDFNDWLHRGHRHLLSQTALQEVHDQAHGHLARTFPARWPLLALDRIYVAQIREQRPLLLPDQPWARLSDHAPLAAEILL
jgi:endonuclease/exonuclease/phosphatase family metal-dependent hydrolase